MGCYDPASKKWCTVTKCSGGYDDATLARLQKELDVIKISKVEKKTLLPHCALSPHYNRNITNEICGIIYVVFFSPRTQAKSLAG